MLGRSRQGYFVSFGKNKRSELCQHNGSSARVSAVTSSHHYDCFFKDRALCIIGDLIIELL